jgi:hypothetical protein
LLRESRFIDFNKVERLFNLYLENKEWLIYLLFDFYKIQKNTVHKESCFLYLIFSN